MKKPIFLLSSERSGSNLIRVVFDSHRAICGPTTPHLIRIFLPLLPFYGELTETKNFERLARDVSSVIENHVGGWQVCPTPDQMIEEAEDRTFGALVGAAYDLEALTHGKQRSFIKDNGNIRYAFHILDQFPDAQFVYNVRDPRDAVVSSLSTPGRPGGVTSNAREWSDEQHDALLIYSLLKEANKIHLIHYEDVVTDPETILPPLCSFLGEEFDPSMLEFYKSKQAKQSAEATWAWGNLSSPMMRNNWGKWRQKLSRRQIHQIEKIAGREMLSLGYPLEFPWKGGTARRDRLRRFMRAGTSALGHYLRGKAGRDEVARRAPRFRNLQRIRKDSNVAPAPLSTARVFKPSQAADS